MLLTVAAPSHALDQPAAPADVPQPVTVPRPVTAGERGDVNAYFNWVPPDTGQYLGLDTLFTYRGENIDYVADAKTEPSTFSPLCSFSGTLVMRGGGCKLAFGWYNVNASGVAPAANEIYPLIPANDPVVYNPAYPAFAPLAVDGPWGALKTFTAQDIRSNPSYAGGEIGFALIGGGDCNQTKYSQRSLNQPCTSCTPVEPFITTVIYAGTKEPNSYYMAFEDLPVSPTSFLMNQDGDFNDFVFYITGIVCSGGGEPCDTGKQGACARGKTDCSENGEPGQCRDVIKPTDEKCDNVDNDCNGQVDDGDLCPKGKVCDHGNCVAACGTAEFRCPGGFECVGGVCIDERCVDVPCMEGEACRAGKCVGACTDVTCPLGQECQLGHCVDPCWNVTCEDKQVCEGGLCMAECGCRGCPAGKVCGDEGACVEMGCEKVACNPGQVCVAGGTCTDACTGAKCPGGAACSIGQCGPSMVMEGEDMGSGGTDNLGGGITIIPVPTVDPPGSMGGGGSKGGPMLSSGQNFADPGCACRVGTSRGSERLAWLGLATLGLAALRRRRR